MARLSVLQPIRAKTKPAGSANQTEKDGHFIEAELVRESTRKAGPRDADRRIPCTLVLLLVRTNKLRE